MIGIHLFGEIIWFDFPRSLESQEMLIKRLEKESFKYLSTQGKIEYFVNDMEKISKKASEGINRAVESISEKLKPLKYGMENLNTIGEKINSGQEKVDKDNVINDLNELREKHVEKLEPTKQHFDVGDKAWILFDFEPKQVKIVEVEDFGAYRNDPGYYIFYWIVLDEIPKIEFLWESVKFQVWDKFLRILRFRQPKINPKFGPGHGVLAGRCEDIFKTKEEALIEGFLHTLAFELEDIKCEKGE